MGWRKEERGGENVNKRIWVANRVRGGRKIVSWSRTGKRKEEKSQEIVEK